MLTKDALIKRMRDPSDRVFPSDLVKCMGGNWLGSIRSWIQFNAMNGSDVTWGSNEFVKLRHLTVFELECLAAQIALATLEQFKERLVTKYEAKALSVYANPDSWDGREFNPDFQKLHWTFSFGEDMEKGSDIALWYSEIV